MLWHYRILHHREGPDSTGWYGLHEVLVNGEGLPHSWPADPVNFIADTAQGIQEMLEIALADVKRRSVLQIVYNEKDKTASGATMNASKARSMALASMTETEMFEQIRELAKLGGWYLYHTWSSEHSEKGWPDCVFIKGARLVFAELKTARGHLSASQKEVLARLRALQPRNPSIEVYVVRPQALAGFLGILNVEERKSV